MVCLYRRFVLSYGVAGGMRADMAVDRAIDRNNSALLEPARFYGLTIVVGARTSRIAERERSSWMIDRIVR